MNWQDKLDQLIKCQRNKLRKFVDVDVRTPKWQPGELERIIKQYPWLPPSYLEYLKKYDGTSVVFCNFYTSRKSNIIAIDNIIEEMSPIIGNNYFAFAKYADGSQFIFNKRGEVYWWDIEDYDFEEEPKLLANSFDEFMDQCVLGSRYQEFSFIEDNLMWQYYKEQGWV